VLPGPAIAGVARGYRRARAWLPVRARRHRTAGDGRSGRGVLAASRGGV